MQTLLMRKDILSEEEARLLQQQHFYTSPLVPAICWIRKYQLLRCLCCADAADAQGHPE
jgi:hypothetical protein